MLDLPAAERQSAEARAKAFREKVLPDVRKRIQGCSFSRVYGGKGKSWLRAELDSEIANIAGAGAGAAGAGAAGDGVAGAVAAGAGAGSGAVAGAAANANLVMIPKPSEFSFKSAF